MARGVQVGRENANQFAALDETGETIGRRRESSPANQEGTPGRPLRNVSGMGRPERAGTAARRSTACDLGFARALRGALGGTLIAGFGVSCDERKAETPEESASGSREAASPVVWNTTSWAMPRGGVTLQGRVRDRVPRRPVVAWTKTLGSPVTSAAGIAGGVVYVGTIDGVFHALDAGTGEERWKFVPEGGGDTIEAAPAIARGRVFVGSGDGFFYCLDEKTGEVRWKIEGGAKFPSGATLIAGAGDGEHLVIVNGYDGVCRCLRAADGTEVWTHEINEPINGSPAVVDGRAVVFGGCDAVVHALRLADGSKVNEVPVGAQITASIATDGTMTYAGTYGNEVVAADAFAGAPEWVCEAGEFPVFSPPALGERHVFVGSRDKHLHAIDRRSGKRVWKFRTGARIDGGAVVFDDAVVFGSGDGRLYALNRDDGSEIWRLDLGEGLGVSPAFANGRIVIGGEDGTLFAIKEGTT